MVDTRQKANQYNNIDIIISDRKSEPQSSMIVGLLLRINLCTIQRNYLTSNMVFVCMYHGCAAYALSFFEQQQKCQVITKTTAVLKQIFDRFAIERVAVDYFKYIQQKCIHFNG